MQMPAPRIAHWLILALLASPHLSAQQKYADRQIDVSRYVRAGRVLGYNLAPGVPGLYARVRSEKGTQLRFFDEAALSGAAPLDIRKGRQVFPVIDLSRRFSTIPRQDAVTGEYFVMADTANDEHNDLFAVQKDGRSLRRLTSSGRIQSYTAQGGRIVYVEQVGAKEPYSRCMRLLNARTLRSTTVMCEATSRGFMPGVLMRDDGRAFVSSGRVFRVEGDSAIRGDTVPRGTGMGWPDSTTYRYIAAANGVRNVMDYDVRTGRVTPVTSFKTSYNLRPDVRMIDGREVIFASAPGRLLAFDLQTSKPLGSASPPPGLSISAGSGRYTLLRFDSVDAPARQSLLRARPQGDSLVFDLKPLPSNADAPRTCNVETVKYRSFNRDVFGFLYTPRNPLPDPKDRLAIVIAYYGGDNVYDYNSALWCEAGISSLSANIDRDTHGDRGGDEIVDAIYGARWLQQRLGLSERQVGTFGMSQGGYNALRLVTFQPETNNRNVRFDFGFAIAQAGYSSMLTILHHTNTESPSIIATGNPDTEDGRRRLMERSPLDQVRRLDAPVLLIHGTHDFRVQIQESWQFIEAAKRAGKDVTLVELPGEGHGVSAETNLRKYYEAQLTFLERVRRGLRASPLPASSERPR